jgi:ferrous iron transport protein B
MRTVSIEKQTERFTVAIAGNPNCGKTTLFNGLTGSTGRVGNWPGVTVEKKEGHYTYRDKKIEIVDLPGIYSLSAYSEDERIARGYVLSKEAHLVINIVDATNLERNLYLTSQLIEMKVPLLVVLNMMDLAEKRGIEIDEQHLETHLGCPVIPIAAVRRGDIEKVRAAVDEAVKSATSSSAIIPYPNEIEVAIEELAFLVATGSERFGADPRWTCVKLIEGDDWVLESIMSSARLTSQKVSGIQSRIEKVLRDPTDLLIADSRYGFTHGIVQDVMKKKRPKRAVTEMLDNVVLSRIFGIPIFLIAMYAIFWVTINLGGAFIDFFDILFGTVFVDGFASLLGGLGSPDWLIAIFAGGIGAGIQTVSTFIPIIFTMFFMLSLLEDSGYMARAAFVMDRFMRWIGLPGKAFVPMLIGFGCTVPAIMATRTLESRKDRILTVLICPFMSCGARLPVYALFAAAFFPFSAQRVVFSLYLVGIVFAILSGLLFSNTLLKGEPTPFVMELPPYHAPRMRHILSHTWSRLRVFMFRAGKVIVGVVFVLAFLNSVGTDWSFGKEDTKTSVLSRIGRAITPVFHPMGIQDDNWPASVALFTGLFAKEAVVGTVNSLYSQIDMASAENAEDPEESKFDFIGALGESLLSIPQNLAGLGGTFQSPLGARVQDTVASENVAAEELEVDRGIFGAMRRRFDGAAGAYAYLLFVLLYIPCVAALGVSAREIGGKLAVLQAVYLTFIGWSVATLFYQLAAGHRAVWILVPLLMIGVLVAGLKIIGRRITMRRNTP